MNPEMPFPEPIQPSAASSKRALMLSLAAITMGLAAAAFLLTRPQSHASAPRTDCGGCGASETQATPSSSGVCEMRAASPNPTAANTKIKTPGVPHD